MSGGNPGYGLAGSTGTRIRSRPTHRHPAAGAASAVALPAVRRRNRAGVKFSPATNVADGRHGPSHQETHHVQRPSRHIRRMLGLARRWSVSAGGAAERAVSPSHHARRRCSCLPPPRVLQTGLSCGRLLLGCGAVFRHVKGVSSAVSGYAGGAATIADYDRRSASGTQATPNRSRSLTTRP